MPPRITVLSNLVSLSAMGRTHERKMILYDSYTENVHRFTSILNTLTNEFINASNFAFTLSPRIFQISVVEISRQCNVMMSLTLDLKTEKLIMYAVFHLIKLYYLSFFYLYTDSSSHILFQKSISKGLLHFVIIKNISPLIRMHWNIHHLHWYSPHNWSQ